MPLPRLLLPLCGLLLAMAVTAATAAAPPYGPGEVRISLWKDETATTRYSQESRCKNAGGSLVPMVTETVFQLVVYAVDMASIQQAFCNMGASTMLSSAECTDSAASLSCIWYWDAGRYAGIDNAIPFYRGNRDPSTLSGAGMIGTAVGNHWGRSPSTARCPCEKMQRYGAIVRPSRRTTTWSDTGAGAFSYDTVSFSAYRVICAIEQSTSTTTTKKPTPAPTTTTTTM